MKRSILSWSVALAVVTSASGALAGPQGLTQPFVYSLQPAYGSWTPAGSGAPEPDRVEPKREEEKKAEAPVRLGMLIGVGAPSLVNLGLTTRIGRYFGVGANLGLIPETTVPYYGEATLSYQSYDVYARVYPFGGGFFLGTGLGYATARGTYSESYDVSSIASYVGTNTFDLEVQGSVKSLVLTPQLGYLAVFDSGFLLAFDLGAQVPLKKSEVSLSSNVPSIAYAAPGQQAQQAEAKVRSTLQRVGQQVIPTLGLRLGWMF